jgi:polyisoprenoid-binding protein YceI
MNPWLKRLLIAVPVVVVLFFGAILVYVNFIKADPAPELTTADLDDVFATDPSTAPDAAPATTAPDAPTTSAGGTTTGAPASTAAATTTTAAAAGFDGSWAVTPESQFGYRVEEVLFGVNTTATGRSNEIAGSMTIEGSTVTEASFTVQVATITSDESRRDGQFTGRIMETDQFPEATFTLTEPIAFGAAPSPGEQITATATGDLTLHGVTKPVTFELTAQADATRIGVLGNIPILFADYDIDNPSTSGITTEDNGLLEFILVFEPA